MDEQQESKDELRGYKFCIIPCVAVELLPKIGTTAYAVLGVLAYHANNKSSVCWPSWKRIAAMVGVSRKTVYTALKTLEVNGLIMAARRFGENGQISNSYKILFGDEEQDGEIK
jgi:predicted AAA+ superfamily ATPase